MLFYKPVLDYLESVGHKVKHLKTFERGSTVQGIAVIRDDENGDDGRIVTANNDARKSGGVDGY
jgi:hypothetical protein